MISELCQLDRGQQNLWIKININISEPIILRQVPLEHWGESRRFKRFSRPEKIFPILASKCSPWSISIISLWYNNFTIQNLRDIPFFLSIKVCWKVWTFFATVWEYTYYGPIVQGHIQIGTRATCTTKRFQRIHRKSHFITVHTG